MHWQVSGLPFEDITLIILILKIMSSDAHVSRWNLEQPCALRFGGGYKHTRKKNLIPIFEILTPTNRKEILRRVQSSFAADTKSTRDPGSAHV